MNAGGVRLRKTAAPRHLSGPCDVSTLRSSGASCQGGVSAAITKRRTDAHAPSAQKAASSLRQLRFLRATKRQVGDALFHFASITVGSPAFIPDLVHLVVVAAHIKGGVDKRGKQNECNCRDHNDSHARLLRHWAVIEQPRA